MKKLIYSLPLLLVSTFASAKYEDHFPVYYEYCTGTQWKLQSGEEGGSPGHGFSYIHGLCKDYTSDYPQVIPCSKVSQEMKDKYPHEGVGISLDKNFTNVMWIAVPGRDFLLNGNISRRVITEADVDSHIDKMIDLQVLKGVKLKSNSVGAYTPGTIEYERAAALDTLGTDHAVNWARELHCVKIPATEDRLQNVADFLNESNNKHKNGPEYVWSKFSNNCVHLSMNASHAMGINKSIKIDQKFPKLIFNMALPANGFLMYSDLAVLAKMPNNKLLSKVLPEKGFYPAQVGSIMESHEVYPSSYYFNTDGLKVLTAPRLLKPWKLLATPEKYERKYMVPHNTDLKANAEMWISRYERLLKELKPKQKGTIVEEYLNQQLELSKNIVNAE